MNNKKYGIYGGSFDPMHVGHISLADCAVRELGLDKLIFMPAYVSPFKQGKEVSDGSDRCAMIETVLKSNSAFRLSRYEINKEGPSYTIETLEHWKNMLDGELYFIMGFDSMVEVDKWYRGEEILKNYNLVTARRPDTDYTEGMLTIESFREKYGASITVLGMPPVKASSTEIRNLVKEGKSITGLVPPGVEEYIIEHNLYR